MENEKKTQRCETCNYCKYPRTPDDNNGACKCKLMQYKTIDIIVTGGGSPAWCPFKKLTDGNPIVEGGFMRNCCICGKPFDGRGNNPKPIETDGVCCDECNNNLVLPSRMREIAIARIQRDADALAAEAAGNHASAKLNAFVGKAVVVKIWDGSTERGVLHVDTLATYLHSADAAHADNTRVIGYYLDRGKRGYLHFKKSHIDDIALDDIAMLPAFYLCNGENTHCSKTNCVYSGGGCMYTTHIEYAVNFTKYTAAVAPEYDIDKTVYYDDGKSFVGHTEV